MAKIEFPKDKVDVKPAVSKAGMRKRIFAIIKLALGLALLPFVYSVTISFLGQFGLIEKSLQNYFWAGVLSFLLVYLFVWEPAKIYAKGQRILEVIFQFFAPLVKVAPYVLPIYFVLIATAFLLLSLAIKSKEFISYSISLFGASLALHLVFSAKSIRGKQEDFLKANYIFGFSLVYIINLTLLAFFLNLIFEEFSFVVFCNKTFRTGADIFYAIFKQLFMQ